MSLLAKSPVRNFFAVDPFNIDKFFSDALQLWDMPNTLPAVNIHEDENSFRMEVASPGMDKSDFKVNVKDNMLIISAEKKSEKKEEEKNFTRREFNYSSFRRSFTLPENVDQENIKAEYTNGILHITVPKVKQESPSKGKTIEVV
ncbi:MAG: Hsp20/alpha crystallin family protein [Cytophagales bacterium]|nr:Hsp20/alpha crystallin family protein [Bernardetiaceae bacterium]MDW8205875.1 Hsp20/alpha crystallin family protein [Cytophagales bacterium]